MFDSAAGLCFSSTTEHNIKLTASSHLVYAEDKHSSIHQKYQPAAARSESSKSIVSGGMFVSLVAARGSIRAYHTCA